MRKIRCCFAGHKNVYDNNIINKIKIIAEKLILENDTTEFWVGNYGDFDKSSTRAIRELKDKYPDITLELIIPYLTKNIDDNKEMYYKNYDNILIADIPENTPQRYQIIKANEYMVQKSDYLICYIRRHDGGAFRTYKFAKRNKKTIFNIAE